MIELSGADLVLPDRIVSSGTLVIDGGHIVDIRAEASASGALHGHLIVPGFIDVHVHGIEGVDTLDDGDPVATMAGRLPRFGVTAFCPTTVACDPEQLERVLSNVRRARLAANSGMSRVLPAHLESNFISRDYAGAQPRRCLCSARRALTDWMRAGGWPSAVTAEGGVVDGEQSPSPDGEGRAVLSAIERSTPDVGIVTVAPEIDGGLDLVSWLVAKGIHVSLGHSAATFEQAEAAFAAGATQATHLFNCMPPLHHRRPGLAGAVLQSPDVVAELICDGHHVHPGLLRAAIQAKRPSGVMAITDGTAAAGLLPGTRTVLGGQPIVASAEGALLDDGTLAGSVLTMDGAFRTLVESAGFSPLEAAAMCATTPARALGLVGFGVLVEGAVADVAVLDQSLRVVQTYVGGRLAYSRGANVSPGAAV